MILWYTLVTNSTTCCQCDSDFRQLASMKVLLATTLGAAVAAVHSLQMLHVARH